MEILEVKNCSLSFGGIKALTDFSLTLDKGELIGIIGPNGAGKTTFFNILTGVYESDHGEIYLQKQSLKNLRSFQINHLGIARTFQNIRLFANLTVEDNVLIATHHQIRSSLTSLVLGRKKARTEEALLKEQSNELLRMFGLEERRDEIAKNLSYGEQRRLEIVRALTTQPKLLLLDEPAAGMNLTEKRELIDLIRRIREEHGLAIILIEHDMGVVMNLCPRILVLDYGVQIAEGTPEEIQKNPRVIEAYLGKANGRKTTS